MTSPSIIIREREKYREIKTERKTEKEIKKRWVSEGNQTTRKVQTKASDNHTSETHVTKVYTPICSHTYNIICYNSFDIHRESVIILRTEKI